jgi:hypothetical protein
VAHPALGHRAEALDHMRVALAIALELGEADLEMMARNDLGRAGQQVASRRPHGTDGRALFGLAELDGNDQLRRRATDLFDALGVAQN